MAELLGNGPSIVSHLWPRTVTFAWILSFCYSNINELLKPISLNEASEPVAQGWLEAGGVINRPGTGEVAGSQDFPG